MKQFYNYILIGILVGCFFTSCNENSLGSSNIKIPEVSTEAIDVWIMDSITNPYNIRINYKWTADMSDPSRALVPVKNELVLPFLKTVKKVWLDPYKEASTLGSGFMKQYSARDLMLIGSGSWNSGSVTLGWASGGYKVTLFTVNQFDFEKGISYDELKKFFHTFHHEFAHILNQRKLYSSAFKSITGGYNPDWTSYGGDDAKAREDGFITAYGSSADTEEFVELYSIYVTDTAEEWNDKISTISNEQSKAGIERKLEEVRKYFKNDYALDLDDMRAAITTAISEVVNGNLD